MKWMKYTSTAVFWAFVLISSAFASEVVPLAGFAGYYEDYSTAEGLGLLSDEGIYVISKSASVWKQPKANSEKLGTAAYGEKLKPIYEGSLAPAEQEGFYRVEYKGKKGWINKSYAAYNPLEIVLMESNVPALCAPDASAKRVGSLSKGTRLRILGMFDDYYVISLRQASAFILMEVAHYDSWFEAVYSEKHASAVTSREAVLRAGPGKNYAEIQTLDSDEQITVYGTYQDWYVMKNYNDSDETLMFIEQDAVNVWSEWLPER